ncbi:antitoxin Xre/MbcA/ParS toxin-binding domain-containing protein [Thalassobaculum sp. OXR-137]|uniref:type II RES/Xre toxin-antitoxin system antitoxin n=1 Tax=Thalassobaculum sp. OXR-137 TaxID=3100173 RepID=UPI002AC9ACE5|nr:antitoxin Xre/MbcA/ParS toxin-binding domain-containing protein [Thalassobaculum sp. OXR-137]WPZ33805.1 antitoxin Xre/MbcA/ParS toxin-binding domain-containing protein [Thalassobaculum sp. OXR-137]
MAEGVSMAAATDIDLGLEDAVRSPGADETVRAYRLLGGPKVTKHPVHTALDAHDLIVRGLPSTSLLHLVEAVTILATGDVLNKAIGISIRTLQRRKSDAKKKTLSPEQSSRAWRFAEIIAQATDVMGSQDAAEAWMLEPAIGLENRRPIDLLASAAGAEAVQDHLTRLEYGVYV